MSAVIRVPSREGVYSVEIGAGLLDLLGGRMRAVGLRGRVALISDSNVYAHWGDRARVALQAADYDLTPFIVGPGEETKTLASAEALYGDLIGGGFGRGDIVVALGGGVVGDLAGFVAATYHRGMGFVQVPTSLLSQVDSSVGGKVAVDHRLGKNLIGAFYPPRLVVADTATLATLPDRERWSGLAEIVKAALIQDASFLEVLEARLEAFGAGEASDEEMAEIVRRAIQIKADVVARDEHEAGDRMLLNFGHTYGHAIETEAGYGVLTHGEAIVHGMRAALAVSESLGRLEAAQAKRALALLARFPSPPVWPTLESAALKAALMRDKKVSAGKVKFIVLDRLGAAAIEPNLSAAALDLGAERAAAAP